jgi:hypothetical protein
MLVGSVPTIINLRRSSYDFSKWCHRDVDARRPSGTTRVAREKRLEHKRPFLLQLNEQDVIFQSSIQVVQIALLVETERGFWWIT